MTRELLFRRRGITSQVVECYILLVVTTLAVSPFVHVLGQNPPPLDNNTGYPNCPSGNPPAIPAVAPLRCPAYIGITCCDNCGDVNNALSLASANLYDVVQGLDPSVMSQIPVAILGDISRDTMVCDSIAVQQQCMQLLDDLVCAATCDPNAGTYITVNDFVGSTEVAVCLKEADTVYEACNSILAVPTPKGGTADLSPYITDARTFMTQIVGGILRLVMGNDKIQVVLASTKCIAGNTNVNPPATACCDTFSSVPDTCTVSNDLSSLLNRPTPPACLAATTTTPITTPITTPPPPPLPPPHLSPSPPLLPLPQPLLLLLLPLERLFLLLLLLLLLPLALQLLFLPESHPLPLHPRCRHYLPLPPRLHLLPRLLLLLLQLIPLL
ncbi:hypothetical protein CLOM_g4668 [Closterium sp. NIES-68]|nr:hypothetical protein CLOM_g4668 [Closterium sp. NIES-68]